MRLFRRLRDLQSEGAMLIHAVEEREMLVYHRQGEEVTYPSPLLTLMVTMDHAAGAEPLESEEDE